MKTMLLAVLGKIFPGLNFLVYGRFTWFFALWAFLYASAFLSWFLLVALGGSNALCLAYLFILPAFVIACGFYKPKTGEESGFRGMWKRKVLAFVLVLAPGLILEATAPGLQYRITSASMEPALKVGDHILSSSFAFPFMEKEIKREDIVVHYKPNGRDTRFVHRVFAIPGDVVAIRGADIYLNGKKPEKPYMRLDRNGGDGTVRAEAKLWKDSVVWKIPEGRYFLLGDKVFYSNDSKHYGAVSREDILGKVICFGVKTEGLSISDIRKMGRPI